MSDEAPPARGLAALVTGLIDYAGLFPPAGLTMPEAVSRYARYRSSARAWALGRFVVPASRLEELERAVLDLRLPAAGRSQASPWTLSALVSPIGADTPTGAGPSSSSVARSSNFVGQSSSDVAQSSSFAGDLAAVAAFNESHTASDAAWPAAIHSLEMKVASPEEIERAAAMLPAGIEAYFELPGDAGIDELCRAARAAGHAVKIRTGGTTVNAFPPSAAVARVLGACAAARVPFKATAGLHHAIRAPHPVTYDAGAPRATMHGFLNVFVAACLLFAGKADAAMATQVLEDELSSSFHFDEAGLGYRALFLSTAEIAAARAFARSFGSCSFDEPLADLSHL